MNPANAPCAPSTLDKLVKNEVVKLFPPEMTSTSNVVPLYVMLTLTSDPLVTLNGMTDVVMGAVDAKTYPAAASGRIKQKFQRRAMLNARITEPRTRTSQCWNSLILEDKGKTAIGITGNRECIKM